MNSSWKETFDCKKMLFTYKFAGANSKRLAVKICEVATAVAMPKSSHTQKLLQLLAG